jgi:response regulator NasT
MTQARPRLLVVDDDRVVLSMLVAGLSHAGFDVVVATNRDEATRVAVDTQPALAVLDMTMADRSGLDVARHLAREAHVPILLLAPARDEADARRQAAAFGALGVVSKPVDMARLVPAVRAALDRAGTTARADGGAGLLSDALGGDHGPQALIALGILVERHKVNCDEAARLLHERAEASRLPIDEVALVVIEQAESVTRPAV